jgi:phosphotransferase system enzyme I (PtsI)
MLKGTGVSPGIATGPIHLYDPSAFVPGKTASLSGEETDHLERYQAAVERAAAELEQIRLHMEARDPEEAKIFTAHRDILEDEAITGEITGKILDEHWDGGKAIYEVYEQFIRMIKRAKDPLIAERAADFEDVRRRLLGIWSGTNRENLEDLAEPAVIAARDLLPSDTATLDRNKVLAILTETGGATSHSALIARSFGIPAVLGIPSLLRSAINGQTAAVDALEGTVILDPEPAVVEMYTRKRCCFLREREETETFRNRECVTADGTRIDIGVNIAGADDRELAEADFADSVGLFRTEFLYMGRNTLPDEDEQYAIYRKILKQFGDRPVILRTLDIGGDKPLSSMDLPKEDNPFLGNRALRLCFSHPELFHTQIRASLRASVHGNLWIMFPMVGSLDDIDRAKSHIAECAVELEREGRPPAFVKIGIMIEVPSIALIADHAAAAVDFASIGSNDLCQYLCAADRMNSAVTAYYQNYHPGLFRLINRTVKAFSAAGKPLSVCGELGGDPLAAPALVGMGLRKLSMGAAAAPGVKRALSRLGLATMKELAEEILRYGSAGEVERYLKEQLGSGG